MPTTTDGRRVITMAFIKGPVRYDGEMLVALVNEMFECDEAKFRKLLYLQLSHDYEIPLFEYNYDGDMKKLFDCYFKHCCEQLNVEPEFVPTYSDYDVVPINKK